MDFADDFIRARLRDALEVLRFRICLFYGFFGFLRTAAQADFIFIFLFCIIFYFVIKFLHPKTSLSPTRRFFCLGWGRASRSGLSVCWHPLVSSSDSAAREARRCWPGQRWISYGCILKASTASRNSSKGGSIFGMTMPNVSKLRRFFSGNGLRTCKLFGAATRIFLPMALTRKVVTSLMLVVAFMHPLILWTMSRTC